MRAQLEGQGGAGGVRGAATSWWHIELLQSWLGSCRRGESTGAVLAVLGLPFDVMTMPMLLRTGKRSKYQAKHVPGPVYFLPDGEKGARLDSGEAWLWFPEVGWARACPASVEAASLTYVGQGRYSAENSLLTISPVNASMYTSLIPPSGGSYKIIQDKGISRRALRS